MKIREAHFFTEHTPLKKPFKTAVRTATKINSITVKITLENGTTGYGTAVATEAVTGDSLQGINSILDNILFPSIIGNDIENIGVNEKIIQTSCVGNTSAKAALSMALYDAYAKQLNVPLYQIFGGKVNTLVNDMTISINEPSEMVQDAKKAVAQGFTMLKIKVGINGQKDIERIQSIYDELGNDIILRIDANQGWNAKEAVKIIGEFEKRNFPIEFIEQPVPQHDIQGLKFVRDRVNIPIMADESVYSAKDAIEIVKLQAADLINIKLMKAGSLSEAYKIASIAETAGIECMLGAMMESTLSVLAAAHLAAAHPNITKIDLDPPLWLNDNQANLYFQNSKIQLPEVAGIGLNPVSL
ncbi:dipeptide epimerase [Caldifermentibacillus hisashii]|uniref:dipeptide epimerase n=1 Tax=Caldifermentibacillus hisashii TaxID=996558 RepID=UPI0031B73180